MYSKGRMKDMGFFYPVAWVCGRKSEAERESFSKQREERRKRRSARSNSLISAFSAHSLHYDSSSRRVRTHQQFACLQGKSFIDLLITNTKLHFFNVFFCRVFICDFRKHLAYLLITSECLKTYGHLALLHFTLWWEKHHFSFCTYSCFFIKSTYPYDVH